jgi:hypothetical protein
MMLCVGAPRKLTLSCAWKNYDLQLRVQTQL